MLILGPLSSAFDLLTFLALRQGFSVDVEQFRTAWFLESMATQILVIFVIRTRMQFVIFVIGLACRPGGPYPILF